MILELDPRKWLTNKPAPLNTAELGAPTPTAPLTNEQRARFEAAKASVAAKPLEVTDVPAKPTGPAAAALAAVHRGAPTEKSAIPELRVTIPMPTNIMPAKAEEPSMSFITKFKSEFSRLFHTLPSWEHTAITVVNFTAPIVEGIAGIYDPAALVIINPIVARIKSDLATAAVLIGDGSATPALVSTLASVQGNLQAILQAAQVKDPTKQAEFTATINLIVGELQALQAEIPVAKTTVAA